MPIGQTSFKNITLRVAPAAAVGIARGSAVPARVLVLNNNNAGVTVAVGDSEQAVAGTEGVSSQAFLLPPLTSIVFILAPGQNLFAAPVGGAVAVISVTVSDAIPEVTI